MVKKFSAQCVTTTSDVNILDDAGLNAPNKVIKKRTPLSQRGLVNLAKRKQEILMKIQRAAAICELTVLRVDASQAKCYLSAPANPVENQQDHEKVYDAVLDEVSVKTPQGSIEDKDGKDECLSQDLKCLETAGMTAKKMRQKKMELVIGEISKIQTFSEQDFDYSLK